MRKIKTIEKIVLSAVILSFSAAVPALAQTPFLTDLQTQVDNFSEDLAKSLPFNASMGLNWSDAHIGQLLGVPPHFGVGVSLGASTVKAGSLKGLLGMFGLDLPLDLGGFPLPGYTVEGRIGGFFLPFDVGLKVGILPLSLDGIKLNYTLVGGDVRYAVLKGNVVLPTVSLGLGVNFLAGELEKKVGKAISFSYDTKSLELGAPTVGLEWDTFSLDFKAQVSKSFVILTPYLGLGASHAWSRAGYEVGSKISATDSSGNPIADDEIRQTLEAVYHIDGVSADGFSSIKETTGWSFRAFGGFSVNLAVIRLDLTALYNFLDSNYGVSLGVRFQL